MEVSIIQEEEQGSETTREYMGANPTNGKVKGMEVSDHKSEKLDLVCSVRRISGLSQFLTQVGKSTMKYCLFVRERVK